MRGAVTPSLVAQEALCSLVAPIGAVLGSLQLQHLSVTTQHPQNSSIQRQQQQNHVEQQQQQQQQQQHSHQQQWWRQATCNQQATPQDTCLERYHSAGSHPMLLQFTVLPKSADQQQHAAGMLTIVSQQQTRGLQQLQQHIQHWAGAPQQLQWRRSRHTASRAKESRLHSQQSFVPPAVITSSIVNTETAAELIEVVVKHSNELNRIHIIAALTHAAALWGTTATPPVMQEPVKQQQPTAVQTSPRHQRGKGQQEEQQQLVARQQLQRLMLMLAGPLQRSIPLLTCRELASGLAAYASCQLQPPQQLLAAAIEHVSSWDGLKDAEAQHVISLGWSAVKLGCLDRRLFAAIAAAMPQHVQNLVPNQVSRLLWMLARAEYKDLHLLQQLSDRARQLLQQQLLQEQPAELSRAAARKLKQQHFEPAAICNTICALGVLGWCDPDLVTAAADLVSEPPFVYDIKPHDAVSLLKGFAKAASAQKTLDSSTSSTSSSNSSNSSNSSRGQAIVQETASDMERQLAAAADNSLDSLGVRVLPAACAVAAAALRRLDETGPADVPRLLWALAAVHTAAIPHHNQQQLSPPAAAADGRAVFEQLCTALLRQWRMQAVQPTGLTVAAWALVDARESGLAPGLLQSGRLQSSSQAHMQWQWVTPAAATAAASDDEGAAGASGVDASATQQLLWEVADWVVQLSQQQALMPHHVADLAAAFERLTRGAPATDCMAGSGTGGAAAQLPDSTSVAAAAASGVRDAMLQRLEPGGCISAAVGALAAAAEQLAAGGAAGAIDVYDVSKMLAAFGRMKVPNASLYQALLRHLTSQQLAACNNQTLVGALRAISAVQHAMPQVVQDGVLPAGLWQQLLELCMQRWSHLSIEQRSKLQFVALNVPSDVSQQLPGLVSALAQAMAGVPGPAAGLIKP